MLLAPVFTAAREKLIQTPWAVVKHKKAERERKKVLAFSFLITHFTQCTCKSCQVFPSSTQPRSHGSRYPVVPQLPASPSSIGLFAYLYIQSLSYTLIKCLVHIKPTASAGFPFTNSFCVLCAESSF